MTTAQGLDKLKQDFPVFKFRNRTSAAKTVVLSDGDTVQVQPGAECRIPSALFSQLPAFNEFLPIMPTVAAMVEAGVIAGAEEAKTVPSKVSKSVADTSEKGGKPLEQ